MDTVGMGNFNQEGWAMMACAVDGRRRKYRLTGAGIWAGLMSKGSEGKGRITITFQVLDLHGRVIYRHHFLLHNSRRSA
jgi:hypothetical protein